MERSIARVASAATQNTKAKTARTESTGSESFAKIALGTRLNLVPNAAFAAPSATAKASSCRSFVVGRLKDIARRGDDARSPYTP